MNGTYVNEWMNECAIYMCNSYVPVITCRPLRVSVYVRVASALQCVAVCCSVLPCVVVCCSALQCVVVCCSVLQCVVVCCSVLQCVAVCFYVLVTSQLLKTRYL